MISIAPETALLESLRRQRLSWREVIGELIDNSFDAEATRITITFRKRALSVEDDGTGCDDLARMLRLGHHYKRPGTKLGRYGVGWKDAACWLWGTSRIVSTAGRQQQSLTVSWPRLARSSRWEIEDPVTEKTTRPTGTLIEFTDICRQVPRLEILADDLGFLFAPALRSGRQILLRHGRRRLPCVAYRLPPLDDTIEDSFEVDGRGVSLRAGIVKQDEKNARPGFVFLHEHRVIEHSALGSDGYNVARIAGEVQLDDRWALSKNKTEVVEAREELGNAIRDRCLVIFEKAKLQAQQTRLADFDRRIEGRLKNLMNARVVRSDDGPPAEVETSPPKSPRPPGTSGSTRQKKPKRTVDSDDLLQDLRSGINIAWVDTGKPADAGSAMLGPVKVMLNLSNPYVSKIRDNENEDAAVCVAVTLLLDAILKRDQRERMPLFRDYESMQEALGATLLLLGAEGEKDQSAARAR